MATKKFFDVKVSGKSYDKFVNSEFTLHVHRMQYGYPQFYFAIADKRGERAYLIRECENYHDVEKTAREFLASVKEILNIK